jgi:uncharacterized membrane protein
MDYWIITLRLIHILGGVFWVGAALMMAFYIAPTVGATAEAGQKFMQHMIGSTNLQKVLASSSGASLLAGILLFADKPPEWHTSSAGIGFGIGAAFAIVGFVFGILIGRGNKSMMQLGAQTRGQPTPEQAGQLQALQKRLATFSTINVIMLILAVVFMSTARYFTF